MNIAVLIGISKYSSEVSLPACALDAENMRQLLVATKKYDEVQCINSATEAAQVKDQLREFFARYQRSAEISEVLIYFSGHGVYQNDALLCCSDFDINRPATTSLSNAELDDLLRSVKPDVAVKVIDACQSGSPYIKDASAGFEKALGGSKLKSFICMASSRLDQSSYASASESDFTAKWIDAALSKQDGTIYYRDIQAALADAFVANADQTPYFVSQGTGLESFSAVTEELKSLRARRTKTVSAGQPEDAVARVLSEVIAKQDGRFVSHDAATAAIEQSKAELASYEISAQLVAQFYKKAETTELKLSAIPRARAVADFAAEQSWPKKYFVRIITERYRARVPKDALARFASLSLSTELNDRNSSVELRSRPLHLESTESLPFEVAEVSYTSERPSLPAFKIYVGIVHSLTDLVIISSTVRLAQKGWSSRMPELSAVQWRYENYQWLDVVKDPRLVWRESVSRGEADIAAYLESLLPKDEPAPAKTISNHAGPGA
jgi:hypothetical protein